MDINRFGIHVIQDLTETEKLRESCVISRKHGGNLGGYQKKTTTTIATTTTTIPITTTITIQ